MSVSDKLWVLTGEGIIIVHACMLDGYSASCSWFIHFFSCVGQLWVYSTFRRFEYLRCEFSFVLSHPSLYHHQNVFPRLSRLRPSCPDSHAWYRANGATSPRYTLPPNSPASCNRTAVQSYRPPSARWGQRSSHLPRFSRPLRSSSTQRWRALLPLQATVG